MTAPVASTAIPAPVAAPAAATPRRVLHVVRQMRPGGVETWLMRVLRGVDREKYHIDFMVHATESRPYDEEIRTLGSRVISCPGPNNPPLYLARFKRLLREHGPYDCIHSHMHHFAGLHVWAAHAAGVPLRIAHAHSDTLANDDAAPLHRRIYRALMQKLLRRHCNLGLAASGEAARAVFGRDWTDDPRRRIVYCGVDLGPFQQCVSPKAVRAEFNLPAGAKVVGHLGRLSPPKNHRFFIDVAKVLATRDPDIYFLLIGDGELRSDVEHWIAEANLSDRFRLAGARDDAPRLLLGAIDAFLFPSAWEGLPVSLVEAQAAGLPCVYSDVITREVETTRELLTRLSLQASPEVWAEAVQRALAGPRSMDRSMAFSRVEASDMNLEVCVAALEEIYDGAVRR